MNPSLFIAKRYFLFGRKVNFINIVSITSIIVVAFVTMSLVIALSVFNGLEDLIRSLYNSFDPEIRITAIKGKTFTVDDKFIVRLKSVSGVALLTEVVEDNALLKYKDEQVVVKVKGVSDSFLEEHRIDSMIVEGEPYFHRHDEEYAIIGQGVRYQLAVHLENSLYPLQLMYPKSGVTMSADPMKILTRETIHAGAVFAIEKQYDDNYVFVPIAFAERLFESAHKRTAIEIKVKDGSSIEKVKNALKEILGENFLVQNSDEQHASLLKAVKIEKLFMHVTISFIFAIASLNIFFCLTMLAIQKKKDVAVLYALGASQSTVKRIFIFEGCLIAFTGAAAGLLLGLLICFLQSNYGFVSMGMETSIVDAYPVKMEWWDFVSTGLTIVVITIFVSYRPAMRAASINVKDNL